MQTWIDVLLAHPVSENPSNAGQSLVHTCHCMLSYICRVSLRTEILLSRLGTWQKYLRGALASPFAGGYAARGEEAALGLHILGHGA